MAAFSSIALGVGAAASVYGTVKSVQAQREAAEAQKSQQRMASVRSKRQAIRQTQLARAQAVATAQGSGALESSGAAGGIGALGSQLASNISYANSQSRLSGIISDASLRANNFGALAGIGANVFQAAGGLGAVADKFGPRQPNTTQIPSYTG